MKFALIGLVVFLTITSFKRPSKEVILEIDGHPSCLMRGKKYTIRVLTPEELSEDESITLSGVGISLTKLDEQIFSGTVQNMEQGVILVVAIRNSKSNKSESVLTHKMYVCN